MQVQINLMSTRGKASDLPNGQFKFDSDQVNACIYSTK